MNIEEKCNLFPYANTLHWTICDYGPLFVPGKGITIKLTTTNAQYYRDIFIYEGYKTEIHSDSVFLNNHYFPNYTFKHNYYFMLGDNFYGSQDSRYWGFVPEDNIIGKVGLVLFSYGEKEEGVIGIRWKRIFKLIY